MRIRELRKDLKESATLLIEDKLRDFRLGESDAFRVFKDVMETPKDGLIIFKGMQDYSAESIKSIERFERAWIKEGRTLCERSLMMLRPTLRAPGSHGRMAAELVLNPCRKRRPASRRRRFDRGISARLSSIASY